MPGQDKAGVMALNSVPNIPVRLNRAMSMRQQSMAQKGDTSQSFNPQRGEMSTYVTGQNKAVRQNCVKQITTWYKEQSFFLEKMNRHQSHAYDKLGRLEKEKAQLVSYVEQIGGVRGEEYREPPAEIHKRRKTRPPGNKEQSSPPLRTVGFSDETQDAGENRVFHLPPLQERDEAAAAEVKETKAPSVNIERPSTALRAAMSMPSLDKTSNSSSSEPLPPIPTSSKVGIPISRSSENISTIPQADQRQGEDEKVFHLTESPVPGARRASIPVPGSAASSVDPADLYKKLMRQQRPSTDIVRQNTLAFTKIKRSRSMVSDRLSKSLDESNWTMYRREPTGMIVPTDSPYKRKEFAKPKEKDTSIQKALIKAEEKARKRSTKKFNTLRENINSLEDWNPLDDIRDKYHSKPEEEDDNPSGFKIVGGSLGAMIAAFGGKEEWLLKQLDPNSPEALRLCRYLRLKEEHQGQAEDTGLNYVGERLQRRDSWKANITDDT